MFCWYFRQEDLKRHFGDVTQQSTSPPGCQPYREQPDETTRSPAAASRHEIAPQKVTHRQLPATPQRQPPTLYFLPHTNQSQLSIINLKRDPCRLPTSTNQTQPATRVQSRTVSSKPTITKIQPQTTQFQPTNAQVQPYINQRQPTNIKAHPLTTHIKLLTAKLQPSIAHVQPPTTKAKTLTTQDKPSQTKVQLLTAKLQPSIAHVQPTTTKAKTLTTQDKPSTSQFKLLTAMVQPSIAHVQPPTTKDKVLTSQNKTSTTQVHLLTGKLQSSIAQVQPATTKDKPPTIQIKLPTKKVEPCSAKAQPPSPSCRLLPITNKVLSSNTNSVKFSNSQQSTIHPKSQQSNDNVTSDIAKLRQKIEVLQLESSEKDKEVAKLQHKLEISRFGVQRFGNDDSLILFYTGFPTYSIYSVFQMDWTQCSFDDQCILCSFGNGQFGRKTKMHGADRWTIHVSLQIEGRVIGTWFSCTLWLLCFNCKSKDHNMDKFLIFCVGKNSNMALPWCN